MPLHIRLADDNDAAGIAAVHVASWEAAYRGLMPDHVLDALDVNERTQQWRRRLRHADRPTFVGDAGGAVRGFCNLHPAGEGEMEIKALYVHPDAWRQGLGRRLCERAIEEGRVRNCS